MTVRTAPARRPVARDPAAGRRALTAAVAAGFALATGTHPARAASKDECLAAHGHGQDLRDQGRLTAARQAFMACAQSSCPALIQADCAQFEEQVDRLVPSVSFAARDPAGADLPDTSVDVDGAPLVGRLDGKSYDLEDRKSTRLNSSH